MSNTVTLLCRPLRVSPAQKAVVMCLADHASDSGIAWPSIPTICKWTCLQRTAVIEAVKALHRLGLVAVKKGKHNANTYTLILDSIEAATVITACPYEMSTIRTSPANGPVRDTDPQKSGQRTSTVRETDHSRPPAEPKASRSISGAPEEKERPPAAPWLTLAELVADGLSAEVGTAWLAHRNARKAKLTALAWQGFKAEVRKAGWELETAVLKSITRNWTAFEATWVQQDARSVPSMSFRERDEAAAIVRFQEMTGGRVSAKRAGYRTLPTEVFDVAERLG